jgi:hypothetical protein
MIAWDFSDENGDAPQRAEWDFTDESDPEYEDDDDGGRLPSLRDYSDRSP